MTMYMMSFLRALITKKAASVTWYVINGIVLVYNFEEKT